ncbi:DUF2147 domain-containing protein [Sediminitomix flava]|uniref:Uncharacterized protein (DUF2147 family) n=1 Tax=Sediminitomix flava TaxID=379075 RepID=A0A315ZBA0_SEDFL|nr:DUF2147 domain-containing protein [Sediminitomix flava]PWJ41994.1 uncharacterized protein (DUF2147 family) [Sediminitomix flava]
MKNLLILFGLLLLSYSSFAQKSAIGKWKTIDDETGKARSIVEIFEKNGKVFGKIAELLDDDPSKVCDKCPDDRKDQKIVGLEIIRDMELEEEGLYEEGEILDPANGKIYGCILKVSESGEKMEVRGFLGFSLLGRSQEWIKVQ